MRHEPAKTLAQVEAKMAQEEKNEDNSSSSSDSSSEDEPDQDMDFPTTQVLVQESVDEEMQDAEVEKAPTSPTAIQSPVKARASPAKVRSSPIKARTSRDATSLEASMLLYLMLFALCVPPTLSSHSPKLLEALGDNVPAMELVNVSPLSPEAAKTRVLCWVNTYHANHEKRLHSIKQTWGKKCDKLLFMSDIEDLSVPTVQIVAPPLHEMLWQKHREIVRLLVREYSDEHFDWVFKCDDDTFLIMENLKNYLNAPEIRAIPDDEPALLGHRMTLQWWEMQRLFEPFEDHDPDRVAAMLKVKEETRKDGGLIYTPGGGGYAMNWAYLKKLEAAFDEPFCLPNEVVPDDWAISFCMRHLGVTPLDTRDGEKRERFHQYDPNDLYTRPYDEEAYDHKIFTSIYQENNWFSDHNGIGWQNGKNCCASDSISFHYVKPPLMELFYEYYYGEGATTKT